MIIGATLYGISNSLEEIFIKNRPLYEIVGQVRASISLIAVRCSRSLFRKLGLYGTLINGVQSAGLEHEGMRSATWNGATGRLPSTPSNKRFFMLTRS
jgi:solute carrier family 35 protein F1/2